MKFTLPVVISIIAGISIIAISATVIAIVSTLYTDAAKKIGLSYAKQLGKSGAQQVEGYLVDQVNLVKGLTESLLARPNQISFPDEDQTMTASNFCGEARTTIKNGNGSLTQLTIIFDDKGSGFVASLVKMPNGTAAIRCTLSNSHDSDVNGYSTATHLCFDYNTLQEYDDLAIFPPTFGSAPRTPVDVRPSWPTARLFALSFSGTFFTSLFVYRENLDPPEVFLILPSASPIRNSSGTFVGVVLANVDLNVLTDFIRGINLSPKSYAFVVNAADEVILASTHPAPIATITETASNVAPIGCLNSARTLPAPINSVYCPVSILDYAFRPLAILRERNETIFTKPYTFDDLEMNVEGERYLVSNYKLSNPSENFGASAAFFIYYNTIIGDIESARNISIGVGLGIFAIAVAISIALVFVLLAPLEVVSRQMNATSKLRLQLARRIGGEKYNNNNNNKNGSNGSPKYTNLDVNNNNNIDENRNKHPAAVRGHEGKSSILELFLLQKAYTNMHAAVDSFTRYIPKDLVKNLLATGQLTNNTTSGTSGVSRGLVSMTQKNSTMLMADVQGFTSISERVQIGDLSPVLSIFFEHMSSAIMQHEGIIVMYIGDAISASFGGDFACEYPQVKACLAALQMTRETCMPTLSDAFSSIGETLHLRIGINSGVVLSGILGSRDRVAYSILGQASDLASSLEAWNKKLKTRVLISDVVAQAVERFFLVRCVYTNRRFREQSDLENQSGTFVVSPDNAEDYWTKNAERIQEAKSGASSSNTTNAKSGEVAEPYNNPDTSSSTTHQQTNNEDLLSPPALLCYEVVGILPLDRIIFSAIGEVPRCYSSIRVLSSSSSSSSSSNQHQKQQQQQQQQQNSSGALNKSSRFDDEDETESHGDTEDINNNREEIYNTNNNNSKNGKKKGLVDLFHAAAGNVGESTNDIPYPCSIVATPEEIEFCTKYTAVILSSSDASSQQLQQLYEKHPAFFYCGGASREAEEERLQNLRNIVGMNRCHASLINAFRSRVGEILM